MPLRFETQQRGERQLPDLERQLLNLAAEHESRKTELSREIAKLEGEKSTIVEELQGWQEKTRQFKERFASL